jgi:hypothetical protein
MADGRLFSAAPFIVSIAPGAMEQGALHREAK